MMSSAPTAVFDNRTKFVVGLGFRVVAASAFCGLVLPFTVLGIDFPYKQCFLAYYGLTALVVANAVYWWVGKASGFPLWQFYVHWLADVILITIVIQGLGGSFLPSSSSGYILIVITSAVFVSQRAAFLVATAATLSYGISVFGETVGLIDPQYDLGLPRFEPGVWAVAVGVPVIMLYLVAFIAGALGDQLNATNALLLSRNEELSERNAQLDNIRGELEFQSRVLTHDIRSPVSAAFGALSQLKHVVDDHPSAQRAETLVRLALTSLDRVEDMIEALDQTREGSGDDERRESVNLGQLIGDLTVEFGQQIAAKRAVFVAEDSLPTVYARRGRLVVMLRNLIVNATRYIPADGTGRIRVGAIDGAREWRVFVADNGCGVAPEFQSVIFEMFRRGPQQGKSSGMGVGLALVAKVAQEHGGRAWVESDGKSGATFWVSLLKTQEA